MAPTVKILDQFSVSASPGSLPAAATLPLTFFDVPWVFTGPVERAFFYSYPQPASHFSSHLLPSLVSSLSSALQDFFPLLGCVQPSSNPECPFEYFCSAADSVQFIVAESGDDFDELSGNSPRDLARLYALIPPAPERRADGAVPLTAVQVTMFPEKGFAIGASIHHVACDDSSYMHFMKSWAANCRRAAAADNPVSVKLPFFDRGVIADPGGLAAKTLSEMMQFVGGPPPEPSGQPRAPASPLPTGPSPGKPKLVISSFSISRDLIDRLKQRVITKATGLSNGSGRLHCSAFTVASAFAWACLVKVQGHSAAKTKAYMLFSVECRPRLTPPIPQEYFGNCLRPCFVEADMGALVAEGEDDVVSAALAIGRSIKALEDGVLVGAEGWFATVMALVPQGPMSVGGSPRYGVYETDFGHGRPKKVELVSIDKTPGTVSMAEVPGEQGGIEIGVVLSEADMDKFSSSFSHGLELLQL